MPENYINISCEKGSVHISEEVIAVISAAAISEVEGVAGLAGAAEFVSKKNVNRGIKVYFGEGEITVDAQIMVRYGNGISGVAGKVQDGVISAVESMTGIQPTVNVHVTGVTFDK